MLTPDQLHVDQLGPRTVPSPIRLSTARGDGVCDFTRDEARMLYRVDFVPGEQLQTEIAFEKAGPRQFIFFRPEETRAAIVTCGGLCPGLNNVIRSVFLQLHHNYGVRQVLGVRYGYRGLNPANGHPPVRLTPEFVEHIHQLGGTVLGSSRGPEEPRVIVDFLQAERVNILFCVGGDGTQRGAREVDAEARRRRLPLAVIGIPKTIDNDLNYVWTSFGYNTALEKAREVLDCAHAEAKGVPSGISLVKLMGRHAGFIAAGATLASQEVNFTLIPEVPFALDGEHGFLASLKRRMLARGHAVIVVAEGAGQEHLETEPAGTDASGNPRLQDIGPWLKEKIACYFAREKLPVNVKYFDPSYVIRSVPANTFDSLLCDRFARNAVHAAMAGKTGCLMGLWYNTFIHVPISLAVAERKYLSPESEVWMSVLAATGQPQRFE
jgi:6-phosphofructokinase 1